MDEFRDDIRAIRTDVVVIKETLAKNTATLSEHMRRTELSERRIESLEKWLLGLLTAILIAIAGKHFL